ncbi:MAG: sensor histidine kinase [Christensenellales bacterium]
MKPEAFHRRKNPLLVLKYIFCFAPAAAYFVLCYLGTLPYSEKAMLVLLVCCLLPFFTVLTLSLRHKRLIHGLSSIADTIEQSDLSTDLITLEEGDIGAIQHALYQLANEARHTIRSGKAQKEFLQEFVSHISHQMKTPIATLSMYHELMLDNPQVPRKDSQRFLRRGQEQIQRLVWLISALLQIAQLEADSIIMNPTPHSLLTTLSRAVHTFRDAARLKGIALELNDAEDCLLMQDEEWLTQAFENLIKNAVEHTPPGGSIAVSMGHNTFYVWVTIQDSGTGMDQYQIKHIFDAFYSRKDDDSNSTGLGLSLSKSIIRRHNGEIYVKSKKGEGSHFEITFPKDSTPLHNKNPLGSEQ